MNVFYHQALPSVCKQVNACPSRTHILHFAFCIFSCHPERRIGKRGRFTIRSRTPKGRRGKSCSDSEAGSIRDRGTLFAPKRHSVLRRSRSTPFRALPWVGFDSEKHRTVVFFSAQDDTMGEVWRRILTALHSKTSPYSTIGERLWVKTASR